MGILFQFVVLLRNAIVVVFFQRDETDKDDERQGVSGGTKRGSAGREKKLARTTSWDKSVISHSDEELLQTPWGHIEDRPVETLRVGNGDKWWGALFLGLAPNRDGQQTLNGMNQ